MDRLTKPARHAPRRLVGRKPQVTSAGTSTAGLNPGERPSDAAGPEFADRSEHVGQLGEALRGDEISALGADAATQAVSPRAIELPSERRFGEGLVSDSPNFQGRPSTSLTEGGDTTSAGGGSGL